MVEMRFLEKNVPVDWDISAEKALTYRKDKVLQYRYFISGFVPAGKWSEWIDVTTVREE